MPEFISKIEGFEKKDLTSFSDSKQMFSFACRHVERWRKQTLEACMSRMTEPITEYKFMSEYLWCVYVSGFSAKTISAKYDSLLRVHNIIDDGGYLKITHDNTPASFVEIFKVFKNKAKATAIQTVRVKILEIGWEKYEKTFVTPQSPDNLQRLPNIGPALCMHLARNLGNLNLVKPDVHLTRIANKYGHSSVLQMCKSLSNDQLAQTDLILWLASVDHGTK